MGLPLRTLAPAVLAPLALLAGCAVGPTYVRAPAVAAAPGWTEPASTADVEAQWWTTLHDRVLDDLVETALRRNLDLRQAEAQLREARANRAAAGAGGLPQLAATGTATRNELSENGEIPIGHIPGFSRNLDLYDLGFDASWELDLWGRTRRSVQAARARAESAAEAARGVRLEVVAEVTRTYVDLRRTQALLASARRDAEARREAADLTALRFAAGEASRSDVTRAQSAALTATASLPGLVATARADAYALATLTGRPPEALIALAEQAAPLPAAPGPVGAGLRSDLLRRRPDIREAERDLAAATADVGVATADLFPSVTLVAGVGQQAQKASDLFSGASQRLQAGPSLNWPIFSAGRIKAQIRAANARADAAGARYEKAVLTAFSDSETALNRYAQAGERRRTADAAWRQAQLSLDLARQRWAAGEDDRLALLESESETSAVEQAAIAASADETTAFVALQKALGGSVAPQAATTHQPSFR